MSRARLPTSIDVRFFVLAFDREMQTMTIFLSETESHRIGDVTAPGFTGADADLLQFEGAQASRQLQRWGVERYFADRCVDQAVEFRTVQCIPAEERVINLIQRDGRSEVLRKMFEEFAPKDGIHAYL